MAETTNTNGGFVKGLKTVGKVLLFIGGAALIADSARKGGPVGTAFADLGACGKSFVNTATNKISDWATNRTSTTTGTHGGSLAMNS
jgi:hypothetical protein